MADIRKPTSSIPISSSSVCLHGTASWLAGLASCGLCSEAVEGLLITGDPVKSTSRGDSGVWSPVTSIITLSTSSGFSSLSSWLSSSTSTTIPKKQAFRSWNYISYSMFSNMAHEAFSSVIPLLNKSRRRILSSALFSSLSLHALASQRSAHAFPARIRGERKACNAC